MKLRWRMVALLLCLVMLLGMLPAGISAAEGATPESINFMDPASAEKFSIENQSTAAIKEGDGLYLVSTTAAFEPCNGRTTTFNPADVVNVPVEGDWTATIKVKFAAGGSMGYYEFFGFYAKAGEGYDNLVGMRAGNNAIQDFLRVDGEVTADTDGVKTSSGLTSAGAHWFRIAKEGDSYTCYWSKDGADFAEIFSYEDTGIDATGLVLDAYSGMSTGYNYTIEFLYFGTDNDEMNQANLNNIADSVVAAIPAYIPINARDTYKLPQGGNGYDVTFTAEPDCIEGSKLVAMDEETEVTLTATITVGSVSTQKQLTVTVPAKGTNRPVRKPGDPIYVGFTSDIHDEVTNTSRLGGGLTELLNGLTSKYTLDYVCFGGDYSWNHSKQTLDQIRPLIDSHMDDGNILYGAVYTMGNHECYENEGTMCWDYGDDIIQCGEGARDDEYRVFCMGALTNWNNGYWPEEDIAAVDEYLASVPHDVPVFIISHYALHRASGNGNSRTPENPVELIDVLNKYPNAIFVWGHNHSMGDDQYGVVYTPGSSLRYSDYEYRHLNFTVASSGACRDGAEKGIVGMVATIQNYEDKKTVTFTYHKADGSQSDNTEPVVIEIPKYTTASEECEHEYEALITEPNCTYGGYTTFVCEKCGDSYISDAVPALDHDWDDGVVTLPTLADFDGEMTYTCNRCGLPRIEVIPAAGEPADMSDIDFTDPAVISRVRVDYKDSAAFAADTGLKISSGSSSFEGTGDSFTPKDLVAIPVRGDFSATVQFDLTPSSGWFMGGDDYLGFFVMDDYDNGVGMRAGQNSVVSFTKSEGVVTTGSATMGAAFPSGLSSAGTYWFRLEKIDDDVLCYWSRDGVNFTQLFWFHDTELEGKRIVLDAYYSYAMAFGTPNSYTLKSLNYDEDNLHYYIENPDEAYLATAATPTAAATYYYSCALCGEKDETRTFSYGAGIAADSVRWSWRTDEQPTAEIQLGWSDGYVKKLSATVAPIEIGDNFITYRATAEYVGVPYTATKTVQTGYEVTVENGAILSEAKELYSYGDSLIVKANAAPEGKVFAGWYVDGVLVSTSEIYGRSVTEDFTLTACYEDAKVELKPVLNAKSAIRTYDIATGKYKTTLSVDWSAPNGFTVVSSGLYRIYGENAPSQAELIATGTKNTAKSLAYNGTYNLNLSMGAASGERNIYYVGYLTYKDAKGAEHTIYTDVLCNEARPFIDNPEEDVVEE